MRRRHEWTLLQLIVACADACVITLAFSLVFLLIPETHTGWSPETVAFWRVARIGICVVGWLLLLAAYHLYDTEYLLDGFQQYTRIAQASTVGLLVVGLAALLDGNTLIPRLWLVASWFVAVLALGVSRFVIRRIIRQLRQHGMFRTRMLIIGAGEDGLAVAEQASTGGVDVIGFLDEYLPVGTSIGAAKVLGEPLSLARVAQQTGATDAIIVPQTISWEALQALLQAGADAWGLRRLWLAPAYRDLLTIGMEVHQRGTLPLLSVAGPRLTGLEGALKRGLDLCLTLAALPIIMILSLPILAWLLCVRRVAPFARQEVIGRDGRQFSLITFVPLPQLRRIHLWRLPAIINVLKGDLSLVGPRPMGQALERQYRPWRVMLTSVRPGLTGPWWLLSGSAQLSIRSEVGADLAYVRNYTIWSDVRLLALTVKRLRSHPYAPRVEQTAGGPEDDAEAPATSATSIPIGGTL